MVITRTPYRLSLFGGGTDYPAWFREHGGAVLAASLSRYCYLTCRYLPPFFAHRSRIVYSQIELVRDTSEIQHPAVRAVLQTLGITDGVEIHHDGDLPARTGIGSSSAFTVGLLHALRALQGTLQAPRALAREAIHIEQDVLKEAVGCQDQIVAAVGGLLRIDFPTSGDWTVNALALPHDRQAELEQHLRLYYSGLARTASTIAAQQLERLPAITPELHALQAMVPEAEALMRAGDWEAFGSLLHESWQIKRRLTPAVTTNTIDALYDAARQAGAWGGKLMGAGGGGFMVLCASPERHAAIRAALPDVLEVPFSIDKSGSQVLVFEPEPRP
jgi:D-glycero-alpha-D-manno-heptose-7-phosphate kinase